MGKQFYIISLKWTNKDDGYITLWRTNGYGYCWNRAYAGIFDEKYIQKNHSTPDDSTKIVPQDVVDRLWTGGFIDDQIAAILPNTEKVRKALGIELNQFKRLYRSECPSKSDVEGFKLPNIKHGNHIVIKWEDVGKYLSSQLTEDLYSVLNLISEGREKDGKNTKNEYYVCNTDEPYADKVRRVILEGEAEKIRRNENV
ncbi:MAG: hypothetical protein ACM34K_13240 [Bacillota bacterium]